MHERSTPDGTPRIDIKLVQGANPAVEAGLRQAFAAAALHDDPQRIADNAAQLLGRDCLVVVEAERDGWSRYRVAIRGYAVGERQPVTIATVEVVKP